MKIKFVVEYGLQHVFKCVLTLNNNYPLTTQNGRKWKNITILVFLCCFDTLSLSEAKHFQIELSVFSFEHIQSTISLSKYLMVREEREREREREIDRTIYVHCHFVLHIFFFACHICKGHFTLEMFLSTKCEKLLYAKNELHTIIYILVRTNTFLSQIALYL